MELDSNGVFSEMKGQLFPEVEMYTFLLTQLLFVGTKNWEQAKDVSDRAYRRLETFNRRTLDAIAAKVYFYYSLVYEKLNRLEEIRSYSTQKFFGSIMEF